MSERSYWFWIPPIPPPTMREIATDVAQRHGVTLAELRGPCRAYRIAHPRQEAFALIKAAGRQSSPQIGRYFGGRDHSTVLHGIKMHKKRSAALIRMRSGAA